MVGVESQNKYLMWVSSKDRALCDYIGLMPMKPDPPGRGPRHILVQLYNVAA